METIFNISFIILVVLWIWLFMIIYITVGTMILSDCLDDYEINNKFVKILCIVFWPVVAILYPIKGIKKILNNDNPH